ncbi:WGR domain-containing protein [Rhizobium sp. BK176]
MSLRRRGRIGTPGQKKSAIFSKPERAVSLTNPVVACRQHRGFQPCT